MEFNLIIVIIGLSIFSSACAEPKLKMPKLKFPKRVPRISSGKRSINRPSRIRADFGVPDFPHDMVLNSESDASYNVEASPKKSSSSGTQEQNAVKNTSSPALSNNDNPSIATPPQAEPIVHEDSSNSSLKQAFQKAVGSAVDTVLQTAANRVISGSIPEYNNPATQVEKDMISNPEQTSTEPQSTDGSDHEKDDPDIAEKLSLSNVSSENRTNTQVNSISESPTSSISNPEQLSAMPFFNNQKTANLIPYSSPSMITVTPPIKTLISNPVESVQRDPDYDYYPPSQNMLRHERLGRRVQSAVNELHQKLQLIRQQQIQAEFQWQRANYQIQLSFINVEQKLLKIHERQAILMESQQHKLEI